MKKIQKTNKFKVVIVMLCMVVFSSCFLDDWVDGSQDSLFYIFKYYDGKDYSDNMPYRHSLQDYHMQGYAYYSWEAGEGGNGVKVIPLANNYYANYHRDPNDVYFTTLTIDEYRDMADSGLITQALVDSMPKDSNVYCEFYGAKENLFTMRCWIRQGSGHVLDTAKLNLIIRNGELDKYFMKCKMKS